MSSKSELAAFNKDGAILWHLEIGDSAGPLATTDRAIYASAGGDLVSISSGGTLNWRVNVGSVTSAAATPDGVAFGASRGAMGCRRRPPEFCNSSIHRAMQGADAVCDAQALRSLRFG